ncbi:MAG: EF-hand domain-containing protein [Caulobacteraceae bacterium]
MSIRTIAVVACAALSVAACGGGSASDSAAPIRALLSADALMMVSFDTDWDLSVSSAESDAGMAREFARADANNDGSLQPIEFSNWSNLVLGGSQIGPYRLDFDRNVDNVITREEFDTELRARFSAYDADENGALSRTEFVRLVGQARPPSHNRIDVAPRIGERRG